MYLNQQKFYTSSENADLFIGSVIVGVANMLLYSSIQNYQRCIP
jgi:hypothetical protein